MNTSEDTERELILWSIRIDNQVPEHIRTIFHAGLDWQAVKNLALKHGIIPLLYHRLTRLPGISTPSEIEDMFRQHYQVNMFHNLKAAHQLLWLLKIFSHKGIRAIPIKGVVLAQQAYTIPNLRQSGDIDILIHPTDLEKAIRVIEAAGYKSNRPFSKNERASLVHSIMRSESFSAENRISIDLHWRISDIFSSYPASEQFLKTTNRISFFGEEVPALSHEDTLILISAHSMKHFWHELRYIVDTIQLIHNNPAIDIETTMLTAAKLRCHRLLCISLNIANIMGGIEYSPRVRSILRKDPVSQNIARDICRFHQSGENPGPLTRTLLMARSRERWFDAVGFAMYAILSWEPPETFRIRFPRPLRPLYLFMWPLLKKRHFSKNP